MNTRRLLPALLFVLTACGLSIEASNPLLYVAQLEGTWTGEANPANEFRVIISGGQPKFVGTFDFTVDVVTPGGTTTYDGSADEESITLRDQGSGAVVLTGELVENTYLQLSDGRAFIKPFQPDFQGVWQDVNVPDRFYVLGASPGASGIVTGCADAASSNAAEGELQGTVAVTYSGDEFDPWQVDSDVAILRVSAPGFFVGHSAIRVKRIDGYIHLQRVDRVETCP